MGFAYFAIMKVLLTGITGNLGYEVSLDLARRGVKVIPCLRPGSTTSLLHHPIKYEQVVEYDLVQGGEIDYGGEIDCIVHCAGDVHFRDAGNKNEQMMLSVIGFAKKLKVPIYAVSTAYVYKLPGKENTFNNAYEKDKSNAEKVLVSSGIPHTIFRPSILTGHSTTGEIQNFSGYYLIVRAFLSAVSNAQKQKRKLRFPKMYGESDMVPVDQAAKCIGMIVEEQRLGEMFYLTNPTPPHAAWILDETLDFYGIRNGVSIVDISFQDFGALDLTDEEAILYRFASNFNSYWSMEYKFPSSLCAQNLIDHDYLTRALTLFTNREKLRHEQKTN
jgi:nucleoside-diphosphate-sugar epimerase